MLVLTDEAFKRHDIERKNRLRVETEYAAQSRRAQQPVRNYTVDRSSPAFPSSAPRPGGGGAMDPFTVLGVFSILALAYRRKFKGWTK